MMGGCWDNRNEKYMSVIDLFAQHGPHFCSAPPPAFTNTHTPHVAQQSFGKHSIAKNPPQRSHEPSIVELGKLTHG